jgi:RsiW-degrading membrane proteinase PrsW (M82 family)
MGQLLAIVPIAVPVLFWAAYHYHKDRHLPEPPGNLVLTFLLGMLAVGISTVLYQGIGLLGLRFDAGYLADTNAWALLAYSMLAIGPIEEVAKLLPFLVVVLRFHHLDEPMDGIIYASFIGLGYAAVENWQYLEFLTTLEAIARGFASPVIHILFASIWGHWVTQAHLAGRSVAKAVIVSTTLAAVLHGIYDFIVILNPRFALPIAALLIVAIWVWRLWVLRSLHEEASQDERL